MKQLLVSGLAFYLLLFACKKDANPVVKPEDDKTTASNHIPDSLLTGGGIIGKWKVEKITYPGAAAMPKPDKIDALFIFTNKNTLIVTNDVENGNSDFDGLKKGEYPYDYSVTDSAGNPKSTLDWSREYTFFSVTNIKNTKWYFYNSASTLWIYPNYNGPFISFSKIK